MPPVDYSQFTDSDLAALKSGDLTKLSDSGLASLKGQQVSAAPVYDGSGILNSAKATVEGLERGLTGGLSDTYQNYLSKQGMPNPNSYSAEHFGTGLDNKNLLSTAPLDPTAGSTEEIEARRLANPLKSKIAAGIGHAVVNPVTSTLDALGVGDGPKILPENQYFNPTYGGVAKGMGDIAITAPEIALKTLAGMRPMLESLSGLTGPGVEAWLKNPELVTKLKDMLETQKLSGAQDIAGNALQNTIDKLKERGMTRADVGAKMLANSKTAAVPYATADLQTLADKGSVTAKRLLTQAQDEIAQKAAELGVSVPDLQNAMPNITAKGADIYALTQDAGRTFQESGGVHPLTGQMVPKDPNLGRIWSTSRNAMSALPEVGATVDTMMGRTAKEAGVQGAISPKLASDTPLTILNTSSPDQLARLDFLANKGMPELQDTSNAWQAAKNLSNVDYGKGAAGISMPLHGVSPKLHMVSNAINSMTGGLPKKAALGLLPLSELGKSSPWMSLESLINPATAARIAADAATKENK